MFGLSQPSWNICQLGIVFFFNFFSFFTLSSLSQTFIATIAKENNSISEHAGYYAGFVTYLVFTFGHFVATPIVEIITPKWSIVSGLIGYGLFEIAYIIMNEWVLYAAAACAGFSGSLLWTGQFDYLAQNCQPHTLDRNSSNLWGLTQISLILGGSYLLLIYRFQEGDGFELPLIRTIIFSFVFCTVLSTLIGCFLPKPVYEAPKYEIPYFTHLSEIVKISFDRNLLLLFLTFCYTGFELSFFSAVFPTMVSFTTALGNNRDLNAICSICVGLGNVAGCFGLSIVGHRVREFGRHRMVLIAAVLHMICFCLIFLHFPNESPLRKTDDLAYYPPRAVVVIVCGLLLGVGDTIFNQQCYTILNDIYEHDKRVEAFAVYRFYQSAASCVAMYYSASAPLSVHMTILVTLCILSTVTFYMIRVPSTMSMVTTSSQEELKVPSVPSMN